MKIFILFKGYCDLYFFVQNSLICICNIIYQLLIMIKTIVQSDIVTADDSTLRIAYRFISVL